MKPAVAIKSYGHPHTSWPASMISALWAGKELTTNSFAGAHSYVFSRNFCYARPFFLHFRKFLTQRNFQLKRL